MNQQFKSPAGVQTNLSEAVKKLIIFACDEFQTTPEKLLAQEATPRPIEKLALAAFLMHIDLKLSDAAIADALKMPVESIPHLCGYIGIAMLHDPEIVACGMNIRDRLLDSIEPKSDERPEKLVDVDAVLRAIGAETHLSHDQICAKGKTAAPAAARSVAYVILTKHLSLTLDGAGALLNRTGQDVNVARRRMEILWRMHRDHHQSQLFASVCTRLRLDPDKLIPPF